MKHFLMATLFFSCPSLAFAQSEPKYKGAIPRHVCVTATRLDKITHSCSENSLFLKNAQDCWAQVQKVSQQVADELKKQGGFTAGDGQSEDFRNAQAHLAEAIAAETYSLMFAEQAQEDLDNYFNFVVRPDDVERDDEILRTACYRDAVVPMDKIAEQLEKKIAAGKRKLASLEEQFATSTDRAYELRGSEGSVVLPVQGRTAGEGSKNAHSRKPASPKSASTITGVKEDKRKREAR